MKRLNKNCIVLFIYIFLIAPSSLAFSQDEEAGILPRFFEKLYSKNHLDNKTLLELNSGIGSSAFKPEVFTGELSRQYSLELIYGFYREDHSLENIDIFGFTSEFASASNISAHLKPRSIAFNGISTDWWRFSLGLKDGYGYNSSFIGKFSLYHTGAVNLNYIDFEAYASVAKETKNKAYAEFMDGKSKLGQMWATGIMIDIIPEIKLNAGYEQNFVYRDIRPNWFKWAGSFIIEAGLQSAVDLFEAELIEATGSLYPVVYIIYKNGISYFFYQMRSRNSYFPFNSEAPMDYKAFKVGLTFTL